MHRPRGNQQKPKPKKIATATSHWNPKVTPDRHVLEGFSTVGGVVLEFQRLVVVLQRFGVVTIVLGGEAIPVIDVGLLGAGVDRQQLDDQVRHHREALVNEVVVAVAAGHGAPADGPPS